MSLSVDIRRRLGGFELAARFETRGNLTALFGRSGSGKTTLVNLIAGLIRPDEGRIAIGDTVLVDTAAGVFVPKHRRRIGYVFQEGRLFPHLTVRQNLVYGRFFTPRGERYAEPDRVIELLGLGALLDRRPLSLSGGEKQRVAIGRALLASPRLLLMDEPLAALDEARKAEILPYVERLRDETRVPIVYVSHAIAEVARLATTVVVLNDGKVAATGTAVEVMGRLDLFPLTGRAEAGALVETRIEAHDEEAGLTSLRSPAGLLRVPRIEAAVGVTLRVRIRARDVMIALQPPEGLSALNVLPGTIEEIDAQKGPIVDLRMNCGGQVLLVRLTRHSVGKLGLAPGKRVYAVIKSIAFDRRSVGGPSAAQDLPEMDATTL